MDSKFIDPAEVDKTRESFGKRLGEIIEDVIGDKRIRELFIDGKHPVEYEGKPTGLMALDLKVISEDTKTALLIAQAAERTLQLAEKAEKCLNCHSVGTIPDKEDIAAIVEKHPDFKEWNHPDFKFVGSERDPASLQSAQATMMAAQLFMNTAIKSVAGHYPLTHTDCYAGDYARNYADNFKKVAVGFYKEAADILKKDGHKDAANKLTQVAVYMDITEPNDLRIKSRPATPFNFLEQRLKNDNHEARRNDTELAPDYKAVLEKLLKLTCAIPNATAPTTKTKPKLPAFF